MDTTELMFRQVLQDRENRIREADPVGLLRPLHRDEIAYWGGRTHARPSGWLCTADGFDHGISYTAMVAAMTWFGSSLDPHSPFGKALRESNDIDATLTAALRTYETRIRTRNRYPSEALRPVSQAERVMWPDYIEYLDCDGWPVDITRCRCALTPDERRDVLQFVQNRLQGMLRGDPSVLGDHAVISAMVQSGQPPPDWVTKPLSHRVITAGAGLALTEPDVPGNSVFYSTSDTMLAAKRLAYAKTILCEASCVALQPSEQLAAWETQLTEHRLSVSWKLYAHHAEITVHGDAPHAVTLEIKTVSKDPEAAWRQLVAFARTL